MKLCFWTGPDPARIDTLFRQSGLMRDKWDRADYREKTISEAIAKTSETYKPRESNPQTAIPHDWIGKQSWPPLVSNYLEMTGRFSESPTEFHLMALLFTIACIARRNRYLVQGFHRFYSNLYVVAVAPSSLFKKSAVEGFRDLLKRLEIFHLVYLGQVGSPEGLFRGLQENRGSSALYYPELGVLLAQSSGRQYMSGILELLCELYDCPDYIKKPLSNQTREARDVYLNLMAATQLHSLSSHTKEGDLLTGFLPRFVVAYSEELRPHLVRRPDPDARIFNQIVSELNKIRCATEQPARMDLTEEAWQRFETWGHERHREALAAPPQLQPMYGRLETHALKFSMLLALASDPPVREIPLPCIEAAIGCSEYVLASYRRLVLEELTFTTDDRKLKRVADVIKAKGRASRKELTIATRMKPKDLNECIQILTTMGRIKYEKGPKGGDGWLWIG